MTAQLTVSENRTIQACFDEITASVRRLGLAITFDTDLRNWVEFISNAPDRGIVNPTFDPDHSDLSPETAFWVAVTDAAAGQTVACIANRLFHTDNYVDLLRTQGLWYSSGPRRLVDLVVPDDMPRIAGKVGHHGGLWIRRDWRKHGLSGILTKLVRCASLRKFAPDWHCGSVFAAIAEKGLPTSPTHGYGYPHMVVAIDGWFPLTNKAERVYLPWISRQEMLDQLEIELQRLVANRDHETVDVTARS